jgi:hypothetical protein
MLIAIQRKKGQRKGSPPEVTGKSREWPNVPRYVTAFEVLARCRTAVSYESRKRAIAFSTSASPPR